ncbi:DUF3696 domain-containing protein [Janthinobacterium sp. AD80]|uniref:AAA family ATPase n=1 Tax=Janthinobacterium sp. AD80 TaxID=1528773 RepID=UPI000C815779|nr:DUF3696 domain-containing protein [Janthinobacterium sp. AD80]PMQ18259.1 hypothetical protein JaAD80_01355 [Janthinobacterium sp. AD80]
MIKSWAVKNLKSIQEENPLEFGPLTLFVGQNSSGKSTLIQSILITAQTIQNNVASRSVVLNGKIVRLGAFSDIKSNDAPQNEIAISFELKRSPFSLQPQNISNKGRYYSSEYQDKMEYVYCSYKFSAGNSDLIDKSLQLQPQLESGTISYKSDGANQEFSFERTGESAASSLLKLGVNLSNARIPDESILTYRIKSKIEHAYLNVFGFNDQIKQAGVMFRHFLPTSVAVSYDAIEVEVESIYDALVYGNSRYDYISHIQKINNNPLSNQKLNKIFTDVCLVALSNSSAIAVNRIKSAILELGLKFNHRNIANVHASLTSDERKKLSILLNAREAEIKKHLRDDREPRNEISMFPLSEPISYAADYVSNFFLDKVKYLGPLRDEPKSIYPISGYNDPNDVGYKGEFTAAVLENNRNSNVSFIPSSHFPFSTLDRIQTGSAKLYVAVSDWLEYLGIASEVATEDKGKLGHEMTIATQSSDHHHDLTHVGVGVSQALPIVVLSLLAERGSTLIFEQPELHLHPKVQTRLADFFMSLIFAGKQCIVETHSEYLISRLRYLSAMAKDVEISKQIKIYFVEKPKNQSIYSEVTISDTGVIKNWPDGFFDETERNSAAIIEAQLEKATTRRKSIKEGRIL